MEPFIYCQNIVNKSNSSFRYSFYFLAPYQRRAIAAVYAFCREVDDIVDKASNVEIAEKKLKFWENEIRNIPANKANHPIAIALSQCYVEFNLKLELILFSPL